ncbi:MAG: peptide chain release factor N(5)-glutamine methyltransferase [Candidatus Omnitrophica bacterium]|nr:peptide chain release factor N(5)-glutamine methyltransferase [Candidatus Omnitrophota bacterium]MDD5592358.1 peptide chain release factor N(5)-glutamine methyltransferase [Candidatus Omnitrophota bacterium]
MNEAELLFTDILNCDRLSLYVNKDLSLDKISSSLVSAALKRRIKSEPIQYILGKAEFMGLQFKVTPDVLIPRPETEILVETAIKLVSGVRCQVSGVNILDLGTGSGCIAVSLAKFLPEAEIHATDISESALEIARANARLNRVDNSISFFQSDLLTAYSLELTAYDIIVSNPPYVPTQEIDTLQPEIQYEPRIALDGGEEGLDFYRRIIQDAPGYLKEGGFLIMEAGFGQKDAIKNVFQKSGFFKVIEWIKDYNNIDRVVVAKKER